MISEQLILIEEITNAFVNVKRKQGITLHQAIALDDRENELAIQQARQLDLDTCWQDVSKEAIAQSPSIFHFLDADGFRYYLPAYMCWSVENYQRDRWSVAMFTVFAILPTIAPYEEGQGLAEAWDIHQFINQHRFTIAQIKAIYHFLWFMWSVDVFEPTADDAIALEKWRTLAGED